MPAARHSLAIALHGVGRHRDDRHVGAGRPFARADGFGRLEAVHLGHLHVHQHHVEGFALDALDRFSAVLRHDRPCARAC